MWLPLAVDPNPNDRGSHGLAAVGRLQPGATVDQAQHELSSMMERMGWMFWAGAATGAVGITAAVQVLLLERRRAAYGRVQRVGEARDEERDAHPAENNR